MKMKPVGVFKLHKAVLVHDVLSQLNLKPGHVVVDGTVGSGGHAEHLLKRIQPSGKLIGIDQDQTALERTQKKLSDLGGTYYLVHSNFSQLDLILDSLNLEVVNAVLLDIGLSSDQLEDADRGFSFQLEGPLDMRMDPAGNEVTAAELIKVASEKELELIFRKLGEERNARKIARTLVQTRDAKPIQTTGDLKSLIEDLTPAKRRHGRIHPATKVFQALRIAVNGELKALKATLPIAFERLAAGGRLGVISFHSLEDRIVKHFFVALKEKGEARIVTKKPIQASDEEVEKNPRSRSAKLRVIEKVDVT